MNLRSAWLKKNGGKALNIFLIALILLIIFVPNAKSWMMRQLMHTGLFNAQVDKQEAAHEKNISELGLTFLDTAGRSLSAASLKGKIVFINFWATWCPPCRAEMPSLNKLYLEFENDSNVVFLFVTEDEEVAKASDYLRAHRYQLPLYVASGQSTGSFYSGTLPTTLVFDKEGKLIHKHEGMANYNTSKFIHTLQSLR